MGAACCRDQGADRLTAPVVRPTPHPRAAWLTAGIPARNASPAASRSDSATFFHGKPGTRRASRGDEALLGAENPVGLSARKSGQKLDWMGEWKMLVTAVQGTSAAVETKFLSRPIIAEPGTACTETLPRRRPFPEGLRRSALENHDLACVRASFDSRFASQSHAARRATCTHFVPDAVNQEWSDAKLWRYGLAKEGDRLDEVPGSPSTAMLPTEPVADGER